MGTIIVKTKLKKIPDKCTKCKFSKHENFRNSFNQIISYKYCVLTNTEIPCVYNKEKRNWEDVKPSDCPLLEIRG